MDPRTQPWGTPLMVFIKWRIVTYWFGHFLWSVAAWLFSPPLTVLVVFIIYKPNHFSWACFINLKCWRMFIKDFDKWINKDLMYLLMRFLIRRQLLNKQPQTSGLCPSESQSPHMTDHPWARPRGWSDIDSAGVSLVSTTNKFGSEGGLTPPGGLLLHCWWDSAGGAAPLLT